MKNEIKSFNLRPTSKDVVMWRRVVSVIIQFRSSGADLLLTAQGSSPEAGGRFIKKEHYIFFYDQKLKKRIKYK